MKIYLSYYFLIIMLVLSCESVSSNKFAQLEQTDTFDLPECFKLHFEYEQTKAKNYILDSMKYSHLKYKAISEKQIQVSLLTDNCNFILDTVDCFGKRNYKSSFRLETENYLIQSESSGSNSSNDRIIYKNLCRFIEGDFIYVDTTIGCGITSLLDEEILVELIYDSKYYQGTTNYQVDGDVKLEVIKEGNDLYMILEDSTGIRKELDLVP